MPAKSNKKKEKPKAAGKAAEKKQVQAARKEAPKKAQAAKKPAGSPASEADRTEIMKKQLLKYRQDILSEAKREIGKYAKGDNKQLVDTALDDGDWSVVDLSEDISLRQLSAHMENLKKIDEALRKLSEGTYGICEECGEDISMERLKVMPFAIYCRDDQERKEMLEAMEREQVF
ncbi:MAG: TraR/DksA C4-type zinc finger protein [Nitrospiraceae bacterium]|nr:TraR/DksA C4-type zinc finger protein [Nitrospiraceae bacterium]